MKSIVGQSRSKLGKLALAAVTGAVLLTVSTTPSARADLITYFNFNDATGPTQAQLFSSDGGTQTSTITTNFVSTISSGNSTAGVTSFTGSTVNATTGTVAGKDLGLQNGVTGNVAANEGKYIQFSVTSTGLQNFVLSYATQRSGSASFLTQTVSYSTDGTTFTDFGTYAPATSYAATSFDLSAVTAINTSDSLTLRITFSGSSGTGASSNNRLDNIQLNTVPEPATVLGGVFTVGALAWSLRRRLISVFSC